MSTYYLYQDKKKCIGCFSCTVACRSNKSILLGPMPTDIIPVGPKFVDGLPKASYVFMPCFHCENPWCVAACPTGAMQKRAKDGIVFVNPSLCVGCKSCMSACPWGAPQWHPETGKVVKCDYCVERVDRGQKPACVTVCTSHCLQFGKANEVPDARRERYARTIADL
jgi:Fe-S-cluster-containing dehydrogenase component